MKPMTGTAGCCARAASGQIAAAPTKIKSRRLIASPQGIRAFYLARRRLRVECFAGIAVGSIAIEPRCRRHVRSSLNFRHNVASRDILFTTNICVY
jgi:hypothetical protein